MNQSMYIYIHTMLYKNAFFISPSPLRSKFWRRQGGTILTKYLGEQGEHCRSLAAKNMPLLMGPKIG